MMSSSFRGLALAASLFAAALPFAASAAPKTICTITVNSPDEKETFRRNLPPGDYNFVELVERGRKDWLASACEQKVQCDSLVISGHFDDGDEFYTDRFDVSEYLTVLEMERTSCSDSCPGVFSQLKEVYLFGCNTLKTEPRQVAGADITRALLRSGQSPSDAARLSALLGDTHARSNRDRMRQIFKDVPVIYGFSSKAPLGKYAGPLLEKYFQTAPPGEIGSGQVSQKLLSLFGPSSMTVTAGLRDGEPQARARADACRFVDDRISPAHKLAFFHDMLKRDMPEVRMHLGDMERFMSSLGVAGTLRPDAAEALARVAADHASRERYLAFARDADEPAMRTRMMALATRLGWLTPVQEQAEFVRMIGERMARDALGMEEVNLACTRGGEDDAAVRPLLGGALKYAKVAPAAALACLGSAQARERVVRAVTSHDPEEIDIARAYLRQRPLVDAAEVRAVATAIGRMPASLSQVRAIETLAQQRVSDPESLREIARMFPLAKSLPAQRAIAALLIRANHRVLGSGELTQTLKRHRLKSPDGEDVIDALIRVLQAG
ncbi:hypothetical protein [Ramlibacter sp.]|uniref:hypothetical protein n=1 Tax=Ramlibacter sp. TaxID=1917967 RepID=UPI003D09AEB3